MVNEELVDAVARAIKYIGDDALKSKATNLLAMANSVTLAAGELGLPHDELAQAAAALHLHNADSARRLGAVIHLGGAATALERAPCAAPHDAIRGAARQLERACREHRRDAEAMQSVLRMAAEQAAWREGRLADWLWLRISRFWGRTGCLSFFFSNN